MPEPILLALGLLLAGALVVPPLWRRAADPAAVGDEQEAKVIRHRAALEALRDVEADRRAGSLDDAAYAEQLADVEERAAATRAALESREQSSTAIAGSGHRPVAALAVLAIIGLGLLVGSLLPAAGLANGTVVNEQLAAAQNAENARQERISALLADLEADPSDPRALSGLADVYLAGSTADDLVRAAVALRLLIDLQPERTDAYERITAAYLRAGDYENARAALDSYAELEEADEVELAFFEGLIALRGERDATAARAAFDRFLEMAPDDPRAGMVRGLREELPGAP